MFLKNKNIIFKIRRSKVTEYAALITFEGIRKGLGSRRGEIGPAIEMHTNLKYVFMVYFIEKNRNFICLVLKGPRTVLMKDCP